MAIINGTDAGEWLPGTPGDDTINGLGGSDSLWGDTGVNFLNAGDGDDNVVGGPGIDHMDGGNGFDLASYQLSKARVIASLRDPSINTGDAAGDTYSNLFDLAGSNYDDILYGDNNGNNFLAGAGDGLGNDTFFGLGGNDTFTSGAGADTMTGGPGTDLFISSSVDLASARAGQTDRITDLNRGNSGSYDVLEFDRIDLSRIPEISNAYNHGSGTPVSSLIRLREDTSHTFSTF